MIRNLLMIVAICLSFVANAQQIGTWKVHPIVGSNPNYLIATQDNVFYIVSNNLYCYDRDSEGIIHYNMQNYLSDSGVKNVYYNYDKHYLVVVYNNCNLDFITDEGKTYNFPDIRDVVITGETTAKSVNDVTFCPAANKAYIATSFGIVEIDDKKMEIRQSRRYYTSVNSVAQIGNYLVVSTAAGIYCDLASKPNMQLDAMATKFTGLTACTLYPINNNMFVAYKANTTHKCTIAEDGTISSTSIKGNTPDNCQKMSDGTILIPYAAQKVHIKITADGTSTQVNTPTAIGTEKFASYDGTFWTFSTTKGLRQLDTDGSTTLHDYIAVNGTTLTKIKAMGWHPLQNKLYISSMGPFNYINDNITTTVLNNYDGTTWTNIPWRTGKDTYFPVFDPNDPAVMYITSWNQGGIYKLVDGTLKYTIGAPVNGIIDNSARFDKAGNLWCIQQVSNSNQYPVCVLPLEKQGQETIAVSDWLKLDLNMTINWGCYLYISPTTDYKFYSSNRNGLYVIWDNGNPTSSNIYLKNHKSFITQDGTSFSPSTSCILTMNEDKEKGRLWMGAANGIFYLNLKDALNDQISVVLPKVPREDGSGLADYLLSGIQVQAIDFDVNKNLWIATNNGLYQVSRDGTQILNTFNTSNTPLSSNNVLSVVCHPTKQTVYVGSESGVLEYENQGETPQEDFSNVVAYPNPIRPDYTGPVTITGLMNNTLVKIVNVGGETVATLQSSGGTAIWDCNYPNGERVNTGVYYVVGGTDNTGKILTKILVVK